MQPIRALTRPARLTALLGAVIVLGACDRSDQNGKAVQSAATSMRAMSVSGSAPASNGHATKVYTEVGASLKPAAARPTEDSPREPGVNAGANILTARSFSGLGSVNAAKAVESESRVQDETAVIRGAALRWIELQGMAESMDRFDPSKQIADLDAETKRLDGEAAQAKADKARLQGELSALQGKIDDAKVKARQEREAEAAIRRRAEGVSASERARVIEEAAQRQRTGDAFDKQSLLHEADLKHMQPQMVDVEATISRVTTQIDLLNKDKASAIKLLEINKSKAKEARDEAARIAASIESRIGDLEKHRAAAAESLQSALDLYTKAASAANAAGQIKGVEQETKNQSKLNTAAFTQRVAELHAARAASLESYAALMSLLGNATPALPKSADYKAQATEAQKKAGAAREDSKAAYSDAKSKYESVGGKADVKDRLTRLTASLDNLSDPAGKIPPPSWLTLAGAGSAKPVSLGGGEAEVRAAIDEIMGAVKAGDFAKAASSLMGKSAEDAKLIDGLVAVVKGLTELDGECSAKYGKGLKAILSESKNPLLKNLADPSAMAGGMGAGAMPGLSELQNISAADLKIELPDATSAKVSAATGEEMFTMKKADGAWKIEIEIPAEMAPMIAPFKALIPLIAKLATDLAADVKAGKLANVQAFENALTMKMMPLMAKMGPSGGG